MFGRTQKTQPFTSAFAEDVVQKKAENESARIDWSARIEQLAKDMEPEALAKADPLLEQFRTNHVADVAAYQFECKRHGDFLAVFVTRMKGSDPSVVRKTSTTINLMLTTNFSMRAGRAPDNEGVLRYTAIQKKASENKDEITILGHSQSPFGFRPPMTGYEYVIRPEYPTDYSGEWSSRPMIALPRQDTSLDNMLGHYGCDDSPRVRFTTPNYARLAEDDVITFVGTGIQIHAPHGCGQAVIDAIHGVT